MEQAMQELTNTVVSFMIYAVLFVAALTIIKLLFYRSFLGKILGMGNKPRKRHRGHRVDAGGISSAAEFVYKQYKEYEQRKEEKSAWMRQQEPVIDLGEKGQKKERNYSEELMDRGEAYVARTHLMTPTERDVFKVLEKAYGDKYHIFCQVRVVDLIQPNTKKYHSQSKEYMSLFRQLSQWHFDYVLCHRNDFKVFCALELDDKTHERPERVKRDRILNSACHDSGVRLERIVINNKDKSIDLKERGAQSAG